jgi:hypothetical protein
MPEHLDQLLDAFGRTGARAPAPPPAFLAAVARRRRRRRLTQAAGAGVFAAAVVVGGVVLRTLERPPAVHGGQGIVVPVGIVQAPAPNSLAGLARLNPGLEAESLVLPVAGGGGGVEEPLHIGLRFDAARIERLMAQ